jgi:hypothetical protein
MVSSALFTINSIVFHRKTTNQNITVLPPLQKTLPWDSEIPLLCRAVLRRV